MNRRPTNIDLNKLAISTDGSPFTQADATLKDFSCRSQDGATTVYFKDIEASLLKYILAADVVIGCVAWLTSEPILRALATRTAVSIVVQKEDFLRPDLGPRDNWKQRLHALYHALPQPYDRYDFPGIVGSLSVAGDISLDPVRCVGNHNADRSAAMPRSHHKFVVFGKIIPDRKTPEWEPYQAPFFQPYAVWTGSFNFTKNATASFENAVVLTDPNIVNAFVGEWAQIVALSEPLNWQTPWAEPEWRIGT